MFSAPLTDLPRTTSFRLAMLFLLLFGACSIASFAFIHWQTVHYLTRMVDAGLRREQRSLAGLSRDETLERLAARVMADPMMQRPVTLYDAAGHRLAGSLLALPGTSPSALPQDRPFRFTQSIDHRLVSFRGDIHALPSSAYLLTAQDMTDLNRLNGFMVRSLVLAGVATAVVGLIGAVIAGASAVRQIGAVTRATQTIMQGDLSGRLPTIGNAGDLDRLIHVINHMLEEIERLIQEVKGVCDNIAHDLRTPLTRLLAGLERARRRTTSAEQYADAVDDAIIETKAALRTFAAMLRISEVESGARRQGFTAADLTQVTTDAVEFYEPMAEEKQVTLCHRPAPSPVVTNGDPNLLFEAVSNLLDNALKFTPFGGRITVRTFTGDGDLGIEVADTGPGIPPGERQAVLQRFYRAEKSRHTAGSGLGLPLVAAVARLHGMELLISDGTEGCRVSIVRRGASTSDRFQSR